MSLAADPSAGAARLALAILALTGLLLAQDFPSPATINGDTSWLIHVVERMMAGGRAYVDVVETNPPMAFLIYWPAVAVARVIGLSPELAVMLQTGFVALVSLSLVLWIARRLFGMMPLGLAVLGAALVVASLFAPTRSFTQREHLAMMLLLPTVLSLAARSASQTPGPGLAVLCGVLAGLGASIKPHFVLVVALPALAAALARRDWRILFAPETLVAAALVIAYAAVWLLAFRDFFDTPLFLINSTYRLYSYRWTDYLTDPPALVFLFATAVALILAALLRSLAPVLTIAAAVLAFAIAFVEQGKGFAYHLYPVAATGLLLVAFAIALGTPERDGRLPRVPGAALVLAASIATFMSGLYSAQYPDSEGLKRALQAEKPNPSLIIVSFDIAVNFPLTRNLGARWASRLQSIWISNSAGHAMARDLSAAQRAAAERAVSIERGWLAEDIAANRPDILVFDRRAVLDHMRRGEEFRRIFDGAYAEAGTAQDGRFIIFRRSGS